MTADVAADEEDPPDDGSAREADDSAVLLRRWASLSRSLMSDTVPAMNRDWAAVSSRGTRSRSGQAARSGWKDGKRGAWRRGCCCGGGGRFDGEGRFRVGPRDDDGGGAFFSPWT